MLLFSSSCLFPAFFALAAPSIIGKPLFVYRWKLERQIRIENKSVWPEKTINYKHMNQLNEVMQVMKKVENNLDSKQVLTAIERYSRALDLLDAYDHQNMIRPKGNTATYILTYEECRKVIDSMKYGNSSTLFGNEKDDSFKGSIGAIFQSFNGEDLYPTLEEKAANLLYFITKNHSFSDGNKRIAAAIFLYFLDKNNALFKNEEKLIDDYTIVALTIMIAESDPEEKEMMISVIMNCMK